MSFSKAKLKRFNDVDVVCGESSNNNTTVTNNTASTASHTDRKDQIEKFFKDAVRFASNNKEKDKDFAIPKEDKKTKGLRLFRTPSLPHRLRFRSNNETNSSHINNNNTASSTPLSSATNTPSKSANRLKGKEALQQDLLKKNELIESYLSQIDVLQRHVQQLKDTEQKLREEQLNMNMKTEKAIKDLSEENEALKTQLVVELKTLNEQHITEIEALNAKTIELVNNNEKLQITVEEELFKQEELQNALKSMEEEVKLAKEKLIASEEQTQHNIDLLENLKNTNNALMIDLDSLKQQIEQDTINYAQETRTVHNEMELLKNERNTLKQDLASKCELIRSLQEELLDKNCEIDAHCDTIRQLCREKSQYVEKEHKVQQLESDLETALEQEKQYWQAELEKRQQMAENELIKIELEKQDVMMLLETTNDMLTERNEKIHKYEEQLRNGLDYYIQLTDTLQQQVVNLKQDMAKLITEKYNYQLTLNNTRSTVNILMERLKKSDSDVERLRADLESVQMEKGSLEESYLTLQGDMESLRRKYNDIKTTLENLRDSSQTLQQEVTVKECLLSEMLNSEQETLDKFNKIANSFQERIDLDAARYIELYNELKQKDEKRESYMQDMKKALDEFATVLQIAQMELDNKEKILTNSREECEKLKLENITLKSKLDEHCGKKENSTDLQKIEDLLIDSELRAECDKIANWLLNNSEKQVRVESINEINELLKAVTPNNKTRSTTPVRLSAGKLNTPRTPHTPKTPKTPRTTPKKTILFGGKENIPSPNTQVLKARNM